MEKREGEFGGFYFICLLLPRIQTNCGVDSSWSRKRIGRLALWESAMAIEVALDKALGSQEVVPEKAAEVAPGVWNV